MAVAIDTFTSAIQKSSAAALTLTYSYTCTGSNGYLIVYVGDQTGDTVTTVTYHLTAMTQLAKVSRNPNVGSLEIYAYGLANPATGANNIVITRTGTTGAIESGAISFTGINQTTSPVDATAASNGTGVGAASVTTSITTVAANTAVSGFAILDNGNASAGTGWTLKGTQSDGFGMFSSTSLPLTPPGLYSYTANGNASSSVGQVIVSLAPVASATSVSPLTLLNAG